MNVLLDCRLMTKKITGISRYSERLLLWYIAKYGKDNVTALVNDFRDDIDCRQLITKFKPFNMLHFHLFPVWLSRKGFTHFISFHYSGLAFRIRGIRSAITVHDMMFEIVPGFFSGKINKIIGKLYFRYLVKKSMASSELILSVSETTRNDVRKLYGFNSEVTGEGLFLESISDDSIIDSLGLADREYYLYIGNNRPHKNLNMLIDAFTSIREKQADALLVLVGHRSCEQTEGLIYPGFVTDEQLVSLYKHAKVFVFPSLYEGFGLPIMEALSNRCPVIASDIPAFREFDNSNISYFSLNSPGELIKIMTEEKKFNPEHAHITLTKFGWDNTYKNLSKIMGKFI